MADIIFHGLDQRIWAKIATDVGLDDLPTDAISGNKILGSS